MSFNGSGTYILPAGNPVTTGTTISSTWANNTLSDIATGLTNALCKDGQSTPTANIKMGGFKITNVGVGTAATDNASVTNVQNSTGQQLTTIAGTNTITAQGSPTITAYANGQTFRFAPAGTNTGATTLNIDSLGAKNVYFNGAALAGGEIPSSGMVTVTYDGTQFNLTAVANASGAPFSDATALVKNSSDATKKAIFSAANITTATTRTYTMPDKNGTVAMTSDITYSKNYAVNGSFAVNQIVTATTTDNSYPIDGWRLLLGAANAATFSQDTADVPTGAGYAAKLTVGAGNNNKFGIFCPLENKDILALRGQTVSILVPLKASANLTNTRIGIVQWVGSADAISVTPISTWNAAGTNPTLIASWSFANTPASLSVTTSWADYTVSAVSISASATNLGILIWSDSTSTTTTTDILRVGGYVTLVLGSNAPSAIVAPFDAEYTKCRRYYQKSFTYATAPAQSAGVVSAFQYKAKAASDNPNIYWQFNPPLLKTPSVTTYNTSAANANWRNLTASSDVTLSLDPSTSISEKEVFIAATGSFTTNDLFAIHAVADARL